LSQPFSELNSWGGSNVSFTCTEFVLAKEGQVIKCPIPTFNRAHDLGPLTGSGIRITHDLSNLVGNVLLGNIAVTLPVGLSSPNVSITNLGNLIYRVGNIKTPEDYLAGTAVIDLPTDLGNVTFSFTSTVLNQNSNVTFVVNSTITVEDTAEWIIPQPPYPTGNLQLSLWPMVYANNATTQFDDNLQTAYVGDLENPDSGPYTVTIDTQDHPSRYVLGSTTANVAATFGYGPTGNGRLTITNSRSNINAYLGNLQVTTSTGFVSTAHPTQRTITKSTCVDVRGTGAPPLPTAAGGEITTVSPYASGGRSYRFLSTNEPGGYNGPQVFLGNIPVNQFTPQYSAILAYLTSSSTIGSQGSDANWDTVPADTSNWTHEFWIRPQQVYNCDLFRGMGMHIGFFNNQIWAMLSYSAPLRQTIWNIPNQGNTTTLPSNYPRRIVNSTTITANNWYHIAIVRSNNYFYLYVNGQDNNTYYAQGMDTTTVATTNTWSPNTNNPSLELRRYLWGPEDPLLGVQLNNNTINLFRRASYQGYIADIRFSGVARYTATFTPPTQTLYNDKNTWFLANFKSDTVIDDYVLPDLQSTLRTETWSLVNPSGLNSQLFQEYTAPRTGSLTFGNVFVNRFGQHQSQHTQYYAAGNVPYLQATAPYTIGGYANDFIAVDGTSTITASDHDTSGTYALSRSAPRNAKVSLPGVGDILNLPGNVVPALYDWFRVTPNVRTQGNTVINYDPSLSDNIAIYTYDTFVAGSQTGVQSDTYTSGISFRDTRAAWRWLMVGSEFSALNGVSVRVESITLQGNVGGWTRTGGFYGDWSGIRNYNPSSPFAGEFNFGVRVYAPAIPPVVPPSLDVTSWRFSPLTNRPGLSDWRTFTWVQPTTNYGLWEGGQYTIGSVGYYSSGQVTYFNNAAKPMQCDLGTYRMASLITNKYATVVLTIAQPVLDNTIPIPGGGLAAPVTFTQSLSLLYGN